MPQTASPNPLGRLPAWSDRLLAAARAGGEAVPAAVAAAREYGARLPQPGRQTATRWAVFAAVAAVDLTPARVLEAHADALAILAEAGQTPGPESAWGVFAAEAPDARLEATVDSDGRTATLDGVKPWCSVAADLDAALVTAHTPKGRQLFRVDLRQASVTAQPADGWVARGLRTVTSTPVAFAATPAQAVGPPGWYLVRPGFAWGGIGVAACWFGAAGELLAAVRQRAAGRDSDLDRLQLGTADVALHAAGAVLREAAATIDSGGATRRDGEVLALRARSVVADAVEQVLRCAAHALGPAPLVFDAAHAARVADLQVYVRQHHAERDLAALGGLLTEDAQ